MRRSPGEPGQRRGRGAAGAGLALIVLTGTCVGALAVAASPATAKIRGQAEPGPGQLLSKPEPQFPVEAQWTLVELDGKPVGGDQPSFTLDKQFRASGFSGCNTYAMPLYPSRGQKLMSGAIALTHKTCDKALLLLERTFLITLHSLPLWSLENGDLVVKNARTTLRFRRGI